MTPNAGRQLHADDNDGGLLRSRPRWSATLGQKALAKKQETVRRFYPNPPPFSCGIALQARSLDVGMLRDEGEILGHRYLPAAPEPCLQALPPYRAGHGGAVECLCCGLIEVDTGISVG
jgi:hypothetical protein